MELIVVAVVLLLVAALIVREAEPRAHAVTSPPEAAETVEPEAATPTIVSDHPTEAAPVRDIVPDTIAGLVDDDIQEIVVDANVVPSIGVAVLRPDPDRFFQHELIERADAARTTAAVVRLLVVVISCGIAAGVMVILIGRGIGLIIRRVAGA